jgi:PTS hybrid protein
MVGIVIISHSAELARGVVDLAGQMAGDDVPIEAAGGTAEGALGTDAGLVEDAIGRAERGDGVLVLGDLGSAFLTARTVLDDAPGEVRLADAPLVEGAVAAAVVASAGAGLAAVTEAAEGTRGAGKL